MSNIIKKTTEERVIDSPNAVSDFEQSLQKLEQIVKQMEQGDPSLEHALSQFEEGVKLTKQCQKALSQAELKIQQLTESAPGLFSLKEFEGSSGS